ncbi:RNA 3'-terminal phosphate cyclase [Parasphingorhabdus sp.]|uniref:RNA 3'-terminal phosphate cyclase n=1 Tax=Parasphingorhabdus sp. TaxID=2709688 RepID=UPI003264303A
MIKINGSEGEGGGQVLRTSASLSLVTGQSFQITDIRGKREKPGMMRQHVTSIEAACAISESTCEGLDIGTSEITFRPGAVKAGNYNFAVGTAGSTNLVLQTVLPPLLFADGPSHITLEGGTHNMMAPPYDFIERSFLPIINRMGPTVSARLVRHGFYPRGGGKIEIDITPSPLTRIESLDRGALRSVKGTAMFAGLPFEIAEREVKAARKVLGWDEDAIGVRELPEDQGPGNILLLEAEYDQVTEIVSGFGKLGLKAERLAKTAANRMKGYMESEAFAGPYLADQLLVPFALAGGGSFTTVKPSQHARTGADIIERFTGRKFEFDQQESGVFVVRSST